MLHHRYKFRLAPSVAKDENVVSCDSKNDENDQLIQRRKHRNFEYPNVNDLCNWKRQENDEQPTHSQVQTPEMEPDINKHEKNGKYRPFNVILHYFVEAESVKHHGVSMSMNSREEFQVSKFDCIADFDLEVSHKLDLLIIPVTKLIESIVDRFSVFEILTISVLEWTSKQE